MLNYIWTAMLVVSIIFAVLCGNMGALSNAMISCAGSAVELCLRLAGTICLWGGLMKIATEAGITDAICRLMSPVLCRIFKNLNPKGDAAKAISMNVTANLLGLGNAATPLGLEAMRAIKAERRLGDTAGDDMIKFVVMNSAAFHFLPTTVAALRSDYGAASPFDIMPAAWISSAAALCAGLTAANLMIKGEKIWLSARTYFRR